MIDKILIDECLSAALVDIAKSRGFIAEHVTWLGLDGAMDWTIVPYALEHDFIVVTHNRKDFLREFAKHALHNGPIIIVPQVGRMDQIALFRKALDVVASIDGEIINKLVEVLQDGTVQVREWTHNDNDSKHVRNPDWP